MALLPFARNEATRFISPTKTLEYMAAEKPIVSTPITDVAEPYGDMVCLGDTAEEFIAACERPWPRPPDGARRRGREYASVLARTSWDATADGDGRPDRGGTPSAAAARSSTRRRRQPAIAATRRRPPWSSSAPARRA